MHEWANNKGENNNKMNPTKWIHEPISSTYLWKWNPMKDQIKGSNLELGSWNGGHKLKAMHDLWCIFRYSSFVMTGHTIACMKRTRRKMGNELIYAFFLKK